MAESNPPGFLQNAGATHTAEQTRTWLSILLAGQNASTSLIARGGVVNGRGNSLATTQTGSPSMAVIVKSGQAFVPGTEGSKQGCYGVQNDADVTLSIAAAHATLNRIDIVCFKVQDTAYSGVTNSSSLVVVTGTPASSPVAPSAPANSITLSQVAVAAAVTSIVNANITDKRTWLAAGMIPATSATRPGAGLVTPGQVIFETDTLKYSYTPDGGTTWNDYTPLYRARTILGSAQATITFTSIPSNLRTLKARIRAKAVTAVGNIQVQVNNNTGANYSYHQLVANDTTTGAENNTAQTSGVCGVAAQAANEFLASELIFPAWDQTGRLQWVFTGATRNGASSYVRSGGGNFAVAGPYTRLDFTLQSGSGNFDVGTCIELEGTYA